MNQGFPILGINDRKVLVTVEAHHPQVENLDSVPRCNIKGQEPLGPSGLIKRQESAAWAAGFIDAEGRIGINKTRPRPKTGNISPFYLLTIQVRNVKLGPLLRLQALFGGWLTEKPQRGNARPLFQWEISCRKATRCLQEILPYLTCKSEQARLAIEFRALPITNRRFTASELHIRELYFQKIKILNSRGVATFNKAKQLEFSRLEMISL